LNIKKFTVLILALTLVMGLGACNMDNDRDLTRGYNTPDGLAPYGNDNNRYGLDNGGNRYGLDDGNRFNGDYMYRGMNRNNNVADINDEADRLAKKAVKIRGVEDATVVITGRTAYVAIDLDDKIQSQEADRIERSVYRSLAKSKNGYRIAITSDEDLFGRLRDIGDGVRNGTPVQRYQKDFDDMGDRFINRNTTNYK